MRLLQTINHDIIVIIVVHGKASREKQSKQELNSVPGLDRAYVDELDPQPTNNCMHLIRLQSYARAPSSAQTRRPPWEDQIGRRMWACLSSGRMASIELAH
jgi:hypothetical protein